MARKLFGTDGIRGTANQPPMTAEIGVAARAWRPARHFTRGDHRHRVVIGKDTRLSGYMLEPALTAGLHRDGHGRDPARARCPRPASRCSRARCAPTSAS